LPTIFALEKPVQPGGLLHLKAKVRKILRMAGARFFAVFPEFAGVPASGEGREGQRPLKNCRQ
jgi:hypothetical protein